MTTRCSFYLFVLIGLFMGSLPSYAQVSEEEVYADIDTLIRYAQHGLNATSGDIVVELVDKITSNPEPYLEVIRRDVVVPSDAEALAEALTFRRAMMIMVLGRIETEAANEKLRQLYRLSAARVDSLYALYNAAREAGEPYEELERIMSGHGIASMIQGDAMYYLSRRGDTVLLPELAARYDTTDTPYQIGIELYFETVDVSLEDYEPPDDDNGTCNQILAEADIAFATTSIWPSGYNAEITLTNSGTETLRGWQLSFDLAPDITTLWNGQLSSEGSQRTVTDAGHNGVIAPGQSTTFGFQVQSGTVVEPTSYSFNPDQCADGGPSVDIAFATTSVWATGYNAQITITNTGTEAIRGWQLSFEQAPEITNLWNGQLTSEGSRRTVTDAGHNGVIAPGQGVMFGFQVQSSSVVEPSDYDFAFWVLGPPQ